MKKSQTQLAHYRQSIGRRLKAERIRLKINLSDMAQRIGVSKTTYRAWEYETKKLDTTHLNNLSNMGIDLRYLINGIESYEQFSDEEKCILDAYRILPKEKQQELLERGQDEDFIETFKKMCGAEISRRADEGKEHFHFTGKYPLNGQEKIIKALFMVGHALLLGGILMMLVVIFAGIFNLSVFMNNLTIMLSLVIGGFLCFVPMRILELRQPLPENYKKYFTRDLSQLTYEVFGVIFLDKTNKVIYDEIIFYGTESAVAVNIDEIINLARTHHTTTCITWHNHPVHGYDIHPIYLKQPSVADIELSHEQNKKMEAAGIVLLDDLIISGKYAFSFAEHGLLSHSPAKAL
jgi:transcriptional regulator with XRE-family HTH domain